MATVNLILRTEKNPANINIRFSNGRGNDFYTPINVFVNPKNWIKDKQKVKRVLEIENHDYLNSKFLELKAFILAEYNVDFMLGEIIDKEWLKLKVNKFFNRPKQEKNKKCNPEFVYFVDFAKWWLDNKAKTWKTSSNKYMADSAKRQYKSHLEIVKKYEAFYKIRLKFKNLTEEQINDLVLFMEQEQGYEYNTVKRHIVRFKFFCNRAEGEDIDINKKFKERFFATKTEEVMEPYLNENEIALIFKQDLSHDIALDNARDNFIIGLWTGLRISDFNNNLDVSNIDNDFIDIKTEKTETWVSIPLHPQVKAVLNKRCGLLPNRVHDNTFNKQIKIICQLCKIDDEIKGKLFDPETKRNKVGLYKKYKLVSSHICRRSFATNLYGRVPNSVIQAVGGWASEQMMLRYIKKTNREHAEVLRDTWNKTYELK